MSRRTLLNSVCVAILAFTALLCPPGHAQTKQNGNILAFPGKSEEQLRESFAIFDINKDGLIDRTEFRLQTGDLFFKKNINRDNYLTPNEIPNVSRKEFAAVDTDGDGKLTVNEFGEAKFMNFDNFDLNKNNKITIDEARTVVGKLR